MNYVTENGTSGYVFGNFDLLSDSIPDTFIDNPNAPFLGMIMKESSGYVTLIIPYDEVSEVKISISSPTTDAWLSKDADGNVSWEEKTHGLIGKEKVIIPLKEYIDEEELIQYFMSPVNVESGAEYRIVIGEDVYTCTAFTYGELGIDLVGVGSIEILTGGENKYPFLIIFS